ncbi:MAG: acetate--CoA ligase family protein [Candidatus Aenigmatarchaeota archaeon]
MASKKKPKKAAKKPEKHIVLKQQEHKTAQPGKIPAVQKIADEKAYELLKSHGIQTAQYSFVKTAKELPAALKKTGFPAIMKVSGKSIIHKTELGGIMTANSEQGAEEALKKLLSIKGCEKVLVQKKLEGIEVIVGAKRDPQFGAVVVFGLGGIYTEIIKDVVFRICPITLEDAEHMIKSIKGCEILAGARGKSVNIEALKDVLVRMCRLASREGIREMDINPLFCNERGCWAADVRIVGK